MPISVVGGRAKGWICRRLNQNQSGITCSAFMQVTRVLLVIENANLEVPAEANLTKAPQYPSGSFAFTPINVERSTVAIDPSRSFLIVRLRSTEMHITVANTIHNNVANSWYCNTR
jgi:hypothetical protein